MKQDLFKGKAAPFLPKIKGIPLPEDEGEFFEDVPEEDMDIPEYSKLKPKDFQNREDDPKFQTQKSDSLQVDKPKENE